MVDYRKTARHTDADGLMMANNQSSFGDKMITAALVIVLVIAGLAISIVGLFCWALDSVADLTKPALRRWQARNGQ